ncbi:MAG: phosphoadenylyl-sulfate reductase [Paracoccaceae bacterium]
MPHDTSAVLAYRHRGETVDERITALNARYRHHSATSVLERALADEQVGDIALVSSFGAESVVLLHMISVMARHTPVLFVDTEMLFPETIAYQSELIERLDLADVRRIRPAPARLAVEDGDNRLHQINPDACCDLRKTEPLQTALAPFHSWITGRKRFQGTTRKTLEFFENEADIRIKVNPLAYWAPGDVNDYIINNRLPRHPLVARGYPSIGCAPCTSPVAAGEDPRAGRWRGSDKEECGIHFVDGKAVRGPQPKGDAA